MVSVARNGRSLLACALGSLLIFCAAARPADIQWGGSMGLSSDYLVRGISRSDHDLSAQAELHLLGTAGWMAGLFTSTTRIVPGDRRDAEIGAFLGYQRQWNAVWSSKFLVSHYSYPWNPAGSGYDYNEFSVDVGYRGWLTLSAVYSPDAPLYRPPYGLVGVSATSAEFTLQSPAWHRLSLSAGAGFSHYSGPEGRGYPYWSLGCSYDLAPWALSVGYVDSGAAADRLFYENAAHRRWLGTVIWRF